MQVALGLITPHVRRVRRLAILSCSDRTLSRGATTQPFFLSLLQLRRQGQVTVMVAKGSKGKADRFVSVDRLFSMSSAFESLTAQALPIDLFLSQRVFLHKVQGHLKISAGLRRVRWGLCSARAYWRP